MPLLVKLNDRLELVGTPVVYACRMSNAEAGDTLANHPAFEECMARHAGLVSFEEASLEIKHEGQLLAYRTVPNMACLPGLPEIAPDWERYPPG